jgi:hypothetical protein
VTRASDALEEHDRGGIFDAEDILWDHFSMERTSTDLADVARKTQHEAGACCSCLLPTEAFVHGRGKRTATCAVAASRHLEAGSMETPALFNPWQGLQRSSVKAIGERGGSGRR